MAPSVKMAFSWSISQKLVLARSPSTTEEWKMLSPQKEEHVD
jgi:hypothetical protein